MKKYIAAAAVILLANKVSAQSTSQNSNNEYFNELRTISTAVPIMAVSPDARAGALGDVGAATEPDAYSNYWNPAKLAFLKDGSNSLAISYTPWLNDLVGDINLGYVSYVSKLDDRQGLGVSLRYFSLGEINFTDEAGNSQGTGQPYEFAFNVAYALKLSDNFSTSVGLRYIFSDITNGLNSAGVDSKPGQSVAADLGFYYESDEKNIGGGRKQAFAAGLNISNVGGKISYGNDAEADFIPTNLRIGGAYKLRFDKYNRMNFYVDLNKLLVPTPEYLEDDDEDINGNGVTGEALGNEDVGALEGMFQSFSDAPGGFSEEIEEINVNIGAEFWYDDRFAFRGGYQYEDDQKGGRQYFTMGLGFRANVFGIDMAYLIPASPIVKSPLENTLRFSLLFDFESFGDQ